MAPAQLDIRRRLNPTPALPRRVAVLTPYQCCICSCIWFHLLMSLEGGWRSVGGYGGCGYMSRHGQCSEPVGAAALPATTRGGWWWYSKTMCLSRETWWWWYSKTRWEHGIHTRGKSYVCANYSLRNESADVSPPLNFELVPDPEILSFWATSYVPPNRYPAVFYHY